MTDLEAEFEAAALRVANAAIAELEGDLPFPAEMAAKGLLLIPGVAEEKDKIIKGVADLAAKGVEAVEAKAKELAPDWLKNIVAAANPPPPAGFSCSPKALDKLNHMSLEEIDAALGVS